MEKTLTIPAKYKQILSKLNLDMAQLLGLKNQPDRWQVVRGLLPKKPSGLAIQHKLRREWL